MMKIRTVALFTLLTFCVLLAGCQSSVQIEDTHSSQENQAIVSSDPIVSTDKATIAEEGTDIATDISEGTEATEEVVVPPSTVVSDNTNLDNATFEDTMSTPDDIVDNGSAENEPVESIEPSTDTNEQEKVDIPSTMELNKVGDLQYYLYTPENPTDDMPLIIYLHGGTNKKADVKELLATDGFPKYLYEGYYGDLRAYVAIPKLSNDYKGWSDIYEQIRDMIKSLNTNYGIDMSKISLTGHSMGGTGTYQLQVKLPNTFACIAPMSGSIRYTEDNLTALSKTKIWAFVGTDDTIVDPESSRTIIGKLQEISATAKITELDGATHFDVPALAYKNDELICWLVNCGN